MTKTPTAKPESGDREATAKATDANLRRRPVRPMEQKDFNRFMKKVAANSQGQISWNVRDDGDEARARISGMLNFARIECTEGSECWTWTGAMSDKDGKPRPSFWMDGGVITASRCSLATFLGGIIPPILDAHHVCGMGSEGCVRPDHMSPVTVADHHALHYGETKGAVIVERNGLRMLKGPDGFISITRLMEDEN
jgi:hypothetical protein